MMYENIRRKAGQRKIVVLSGIDQMARPLPVASLKKVLDNRKLTFRKAPLTPGFLKANFEGA